jgi:hypothetical protein
MCTVSWVHQPGGYHLLCNRDEKLTRGAALGPIAFQRGGVRYLAPVDADFGGTWLAVNELGLSVCLLNGDANGASAGIGLPRRSRGLLIRELAWASTVDECVQWLNQLDLRPYQAFFLLVLEPGPSAIVAQWDGTDLTVDPAADSRMPLTSSSYDAAGVRRFRLNELSRRANPTGIVDPAQLYDFHSSHSASADAYSPCMHREDAETVSFSWVVVTREDVRFQYWPAAPCRTARVERQILPRAA